MMSRRSVFRLAFGLALAVITSVAVFCHDRTVRRNAPPSPPDAANSAGAQVVALRAAAETPPHASLADAARSRMPISWNDAYRPVVTDPDAAALRRREILYAERAGPGGAVAQTIGLIDAPPDACFAVVKDYEHYVELMPFTDQARVLRRFRLSGPTDAGAEAVDFWTRVNVGVAKTGYLLRIAHLEDRPARRYRSYWTLVGDPSAEGYTQPDGRPYQNDLEVDIGSHLFEPEPGMQARTRHTYTLRLVGKGWRRRVLSLGGGSSMREVTRRIREAVEARRAADRPALPPEKLATDVSGGM